MSASHGIWERTTSTNQSRFPSVSTIEKAEWIEEDKQAQVTEVKTPEGLLASDAVGSWGPSLEPWESSKEAESRALHFWHKLISAALGQNQHTV